MKYLSEFGPIARRGGSIVAIGAGCNFATPQETSSDVSLYIMFAAKIVLIALAFARLA